MPMWRCPHCGTPQAETARCWVCRRSSTACATCRHFRRSVAAQVGYCGLDRQRRPLRGDEIRACWEAATTPIEVAAPSAPAFPLAASDLPRDRTPVRRLEFVEVRSGPSREPEAVVAAATSAAVAAVAARPEIVTASVATLPEPSEPPVAIAAAEPTWSLWGDVDA